MVLYQAVVAAVPYLSVSQRADLLRRPRWLILAVIPLFAITGTYQTINNPFVTITDFETAEAFRATSAYAQALFWKHGFVLLSMALTLAVTFWLAPRMAQSVAPVAIAGGAGPGPGPRRSPSTRARAMGEHRRPGRAGQPRTRLPAGLGQRRLLPGPAAVRRGDGLPATLSP